MKRYLLDTGIASDLVNRRAGVDDRAREVARQGSRLGIATPVLAELLAGIEYSNDPERHRKRLWHGLAGITLWAFDKMAAQEYGRLCASLRRLGRPIQQIDMQIAAMALSLGDCVVITKDSDFAMIPGLDVEDWSKPS